MRYFLLVFALLFSCNISFADDMFDVDYNFIDSAFEGIKPITDKEFDDTINRLTPQPVDDSPTGRLKTFLFGRKYGVEAPVVKQEEPIDIGGEKQAIDEIKNGINYLKLLVSIQDSNGKIIPVGNYKIKEKIIDENNMLIFYQGNKEYGALKLQLFEDNLKNKNDLIYSRLDIINDDIVRIVYSTISDTKCAYARVNLQN